MFPKRTLLLVTAISIAAALIVSGAPPGVRPGGNIAAGSEPLVTTIPLGNTPSGVAVNPLTNRVYVGIAGENSVAVIDGTTDAVVATIPVGAYPEGLAVNTATNHIYVNNYDADSVTVIDGATDAVLSTIPVGDAPFRIGYNPTTNRLYVTNRFSVDLTVIDGATDTVVGNIPLASAPEDIDINPLTNRIYVSHCGTDNVTVINGATEQIVTVIPAGSHPHGVAVNTNTNRVYIGNSGANTVSVIDGATDTEALKITVGAHPHGTAVSNAANRVYASSYSYGYVSIIDGTTDAVAATIPVGDCPYSVEVNPITNRAYVVRPCSNAVSVIKDLGGDADADVVPDAVDNCPSVGNPDQANVDGQRQPNGSQVDGEWASNPAQDGLGDVCDSDNDNDGLPDSSEYEASCPYRLVADSDGDRALDGYEAAMGSDPCNAASKPVCTGTTDSDGDGFTDCMEHSGYNTCAFAGDTAPGYTTCASPTDSDGDGCPDWIEIVDVNGDRKADMNDAMYVAKRVFNLIPASDSDPVLDMDKNGRLGISDAFLAAKNSNLVRSHSTCPSDG